MPKSTRPISTVKRYRAFKKALIDESTTVTGFAARLGISRVHLIRSFHVPENAARRVHDAIDALIAKHSQRAA